MFEYFYNEILRRTIIGFGTLFNNLTIKATNASDSVVSVTKVPLAYGPTQKFLARLEQSADLNKSTAMTLPRMSFEFTGLTYDPSRKVTTTQTFVVKDPNTGEETKKGFMPVPYNMQFELAIMCKLNDDALQIVEQILPYFQPVFNISVKLVDLTKEVKDIPIILNSVNMQDDYEGDFLKRRALIHTLTFTAKTYLYGPVATSDVIRTVNVDIGTAINAGSRYVRYSATPKALEDYNSDGSSIQFTAFNISSNTITLANHGFVTGDFVTYRSDPNGQPTGGLTDNKEYYIIKIDNNNFRVAGTKYNAQRGYGIDLTSQGTGGNHKFSIINTLDDAFVESDDNFGFNDTWTEY